MKRLILIIKNFFHYITSYDGVKGKLAYRWYSDELLQERVENT